MKLSISNALPLRPPQMRQPLEWRLERTDDLNRRLYVHPDNGRAYEIFSTFGRGSGFDVFIDGKFVGRVYHPGELP